MSTNTFAGEIVSVCKHCKGDLRRAANTRTAGTWEHVTDPGDGHKAAARHQCATCKGDPYYVAAANADVIGCHHCGTRSFYRLGD